MVTRKKRVSSKANDSIYIVGSYAWAMDQLRNSNTPMHRRGWEDGRSVSPGTVWKPTATDKHSLDWQSYIAVPALAVDHPDAYVDTSDDKPETSSWVSYGAILLFIVVVVGAALYANGSYKLPF